MSFTTNANYSFIISLNEKNIYMCVKCLDQVYESNVDQKELQLPFELENIYIIINNCFKGEAGYSTDINFSSGLLKLTFNAIVGGFLKINFDAILREKIKKYDTLVKKTRVTPNVKSRLFKKFYM